MNQDLKTLYQTQLKGELSGMEGLRRKARKEAIIGGIFALPSFLMFLILQDGNEWFGLAPGGGAIFFGIRFQMVWNELRGVYKKKVVSKVIQLVNPDWKYHPEEHIPKDIYKKSGLFRKRVDRYQGDDLITGLIDETDFACSELHTEYKTESRDSDGNTKTEWHTIFKGLFFHADFHKNFSGETYVRPDFSEKTFGRFGKRFQKMSKRGELIHLENAAFEKEFVVHSTDQVEARYILTPKMMEAMLRLKQIHGKTFYFSFVRSRVFCAITIRKQLFEPPLFRSGVNLKGIEKIYELVKINESIVHEMNLNTRIWTKV